MLKRLNLKCGTYRTELKIRYSERMMVPEKVTEIWVPSGSVTDVLLICLVLMNNWMS